MTEDDLYITLRLSVTVREIGIEPDDYITHYEGDITDVDERIGTVSIMVADLESAYLAGTHPHDVLDAHSAGAAHFCPVVHRNGFYKSLRNLSGHFICPALLIDRMEVDAGRRGKGIGERAIDIAARTIGLPCPVVMLYAFPIQWEGRVDEGPKEFSRDRTRLIRYYERIGFVKTNFYGVMAKKNQYFLT